MSSAAGLVRKLVEWRNERKLAAERAARINTLHMHLNTAALRFQAILRADGDRERIRMAYDGMCNIRKVQREMAEIGMDYQGG